MGYRGLVSVLCVSLLSADVKINEIVPKGIPEWVELYNTGDTAVTLNGWKLTDDEGCIIDLTGRTIAPGGYDTIVIDTSLYGGPILNNDGDILFLVNDLGDTVDQVGFGIMGAAPLAPLYYSIARISDGYDTDDDARDWNIDKTETPEAPNDPPGVNLGSSLIINEIDPFPANYGPDSVELYNPTPDTINLQGWFISDGDYLVPIDSPVVVPPGGFGVIVEGIHWASGTVEFTNDEVAYLFNPDTIRVDQLGWYNEWNDYTFQRYPDGNGPNDGYTWETSGGGVTLFDTTATWGAPNVWPTGVEEENAAQPELFVVKDGVSKDIIFTAKEPVKVSILDVQGRILKKIIASSGETGKLSAKKGIYYLIAEDEKERREVRRVVIIR